MQFEMRGQRSVQVIACLSEAIDFQNTIGKDVIEERVMALSAYTKARLVEIPGVELTCSNDPEMSSGLTALMINGKIGMSPYIKLYSKLRDEYNVIARFVSYTDYPGGPSKTVLRVSTHIYNNYDQIDCLIQGIEENLYLF